MSQLKRRYLRRHYHPAFGYYVSFEIVRRPDPDRQTPIGPIAGTVASPDLPLAWDAVEAEQMWEQGEPFGYLVRSRGDFPRESPGQIVAGWAEAKSYEYSRAAGKPPDFSEVMDCRAYVRERRL